MFTYNTIDMLVSTLFMLASTTLFQPGNKL